MRGVVAVKDFLSTKASHSILKFLMIRSCSSMPAVSSQHKVSQHLTMSTQFCRRSIAFVPSLKCEVGTVWSGLSSSYTLPPGCLRLATMVFKFSDVSSMKSSGLSIPSSANLEIVTSSVPNCASKNDLSLPHQDSLQAAS